MTSPWGSIILFGIDKMTKYHIKLLLYTTTVALVSNKTSHNAMNAKQKKAIDDYCNSQGR